MRTMPSLVAAVCLLAPGCEASRPPVRGPISITVNCWGQGPCADVAVMTLDPEGALVASAATDAAGRATLDAVEGGSVTCAAPDGLYTVLGVVPGDDIPMGALPASVADSGLVDAVAAFPGAFPGAESYSFEPGCGGGNGWFELPTSATVQIPMCAFDPTDGTAVLVLTARTGPASETLVAYSLARDVTPGAEVTFPPWQTDLAELPVELTDAPRTLYSGFIYAQFARAGTWYGLNQTSGPTQLAEGGSVTGTFSYPPGLFDAAWLLYALSADAPSTGQQIFETKRPGPPSALRVDLTRDQLPWVVSSAAMPTKAGTIVTWEPDADFAAASLLQIRLEWRDSSTAGRWLILAPPDSRSPLTLPALPAEMRPPAWDADMTVAEVYFVDLDGVGYAEVRNDFGPDLQGRDAVLGRGQVTLRMSATGESAPWRH